MTGLGWTAGGRCKSFCLPFFCFVFLPWIHWCRKVPMLRRHGALHAVLLLDRALFNSLAITATCRYKTNVHYNIDRWVRGEHVRVTRLSERKPSHNPGSCRPRKWRLGFWHLGPRCWWSLSVTSPRPEWQTEDWMWHASAVPSTCSFPPRSMPTTLVFLCTQARLKSFFGIDTIKNVPRVNGNRELNIFV